MTSEQQRLVEDNLPLVYFIISREYPTFIGDEDLAQSASLGLCQAANNWDETKGLFSTYAGKCIRNEINKEFIRRKPHSKNISLQTTLTEKMTLDEVLVGDEDIVVMDEKFYDTLTDEEIKAFELFYVGYSAEEIAEVMRCKVPKANKLLRIVKKKWERFNEN
jgi:RNA polymerase sigma factor (sigma-70 family)